MGININRSNPMNKEEAHTIFEELLPTPRTNQKSTFRLYPHAVVNSYNLWIDLKDEVIATLPKIFEHQDAISMQRVFMTLYLDFGG